MAKTLFIQCTSVGLSTENYFNLFYTIGGSSTLIPAVDNDGVSVSPLSAGQLITGVTIVTPDNVDQIVVNSPVGFCKDTYNYALAPGVSPSLTPSATVTPSVTPTTTPTPTISTTASVSATPSVTPSISTTASPSISPSISTTASISATPSVTPTISTTASPSISPSISTTASVSATPSVTPTISNIASTTPTPSVTPTISITASVTPTISTTASPSISPSISTTASVSATPSVTPTISITASVTPTISTTASPSISPSISTTASISVTPSVTPTISTTASISATPSITPTISTTASPSISPSISTTASVSATPSVTPTISTTASPSISPTISTTASVSRTPSVTPSNSAVGFQFGTYTAGAPGSTPTDYGDSTTACRQSDTLTGQNLYQLPADGGIPLVGAQLYTNNSCTTTWAPAIGSSRWFKLGRSGTYWAVLVSTGGVVQTVTDCSTIPSNTPSASVTPTPSITPTISTTASISPTPTISTTATLSVTPTISTTASVSRTPSVTPSTSTLGVQFGTFTTGAPGSAPTDYGDSTTACRQSDTLTGQNLYQKPADGTIPTVSAQLYTNISCTTAWAPAIGSSRWFKLGRSGTYWAVQVSTGGVVQAVTDCSTIPSNTPSATVTQTPTISTTASVSSTPSATVTPTQTQTPTPTPTISTTASVSRTPSVTPSNSAVGFQFGTYTAGAPGSAPTDYLDSATACRQSDTLTGQQLYQKPADGGTPSVGAQLYTNVSCTTAWSPSIPGNRFFKLGRSGTYWAVLVSTGGVVQSVTDCTTIPSNTPSATMTPTPTPTPTLTPTPSPSVTYFFNVYTVNATDCSTTYSFLAYTINEPHSDGYYLLSGTRYYFANTTGEGGTNVTGQLTSTTCTPAPPAYDFYNAIDYPCSDCSNQGSTVVCFPAGSSVTLNKWYFWSLAGTDSFKITSSTTDPGGAVPLLYATDGPFNSCTIACSV